MNDINLNVNGIVQYLRTKLGGGELSLNKKEDENQIEVGGDNLRALIREEYNVTAREEDEICRQITDRYGRDVIGTYHIIGLSQQGDKDE